MERGTIKITYNDRNGKIIPSVEIRLTEDNNLWLTACETARLFNCFAGKINAVIKSLFAEKILWEDDVTRTYRYTDKRIEKQCVFYSLEALIAVSYRINTLESQIFRRLIHSSFREYMEKKNNSFHIPLCLKSPCYN